jgi:hypothetical protein
MNSNSWFRPDLSYENIVLINKKAYYVILIKDGKNNTKFKANV